MLKMTCHVIICFTLPCFALSCLAAHFAGQIQFQFDRIVLELKRFVALLWSIVFFAVVVVFFFEFILEMYNSKHTNEIRKLEILLGCPCVHRNLLLTDSIYMDLNERCK